MNTEERWKLIAGSKYRVSSLGNVANPYGRILKPQFASNTRRYLQVRIYDGIHSKGRLEYVHRLVAEAFIGKIPKGYEVNHIDCNSCNNHVNNLEIVTPHENMKRYWMSEYAYEPNTNTLGKSRLTPEDVISIRKRAANGARTKDLAEEYNVYPSLISNIKHRHTWAWLH